MAGQTAGLVRVLGVVLEIGFGFGMPPFFLCGKSVTIINDLWWDGGQALSLVGLLGPWRHDL